MLGSLRYAARGLRRAPGFTAVAVLTIAVGMGASTAIVSVVDGVLLRPLPFRDPDRLVTIQETFLPQMPELGVSREHYFAWRQQATCFASLGATHESSYNLAGRGEPRRVSAGRVTATVFPTLGVEPVLGRGFTTAEDRPGGPKVVVLGHGFWTRQLGGRREVLGRDAGPGRRAAHHRRGDAPGVPARRTARPLHPGGL
jgi:putative ABC transport system permease protein